MQFTPGKSYAGFMLKTACEIDEIKSKVFLFEHELLGFPLLAIKNDDSNKTFAAAFNTIPTDSTGVAHILEHSVLMGSRKYPVKDVFGEVNKGGLMTFLNAMTGSDITYYPFATRNLKEYFNLMDIYCDVVFNPLLEKTTFEQEGWHYHQEKPDAPLEFQGVVYNEMKGAFSDPIRLIFHHMFGGLMPGSTYAHESGGDPKNIPDLTYERFCDFHRQHYHPSNGMFFVYGDAPLKDELDFLQNRFFKTFGQREPRRQIEPGRLISSPVFITDTYAVDQDDTAGKTFLAIGTSVADVLDRERNAAFQIIANILYNSDASPLKNAIISSGLCKDFGGFYLSSSSFKTFMVSYLVGSEAERLTDFLNLHAATLKTMAKDGLDPELVVSELNKYEFSVREESSKAQRGLDLIGKAMVAFKYGTDPFDNLVSEEIIRTVRKKALESRYFENLMEEFLVDNQATVMVTLTPDTQKLIQSRQEEQQRLTEYAKTLSAPEKEAVIAKTNDLLLQQQTPNSPETLALLPQLNLADLSSAIRFHAVQPTTMFDRQVLVSELTTNHITYLDIGFDFSCLPAHLLPWLDLFGTIITEIGTERLDHIRFAKEIATITGGFSHSLMTYGRKNSPNTIKPVFWLHLKCLPEYLERSLHLLAEIFSEFSFKNRNRIREIVAREFAWDEHSAQSEGYNLPMLRVFSHLGPAGRYNELFSGASCYLKIKELAGNYQALESGFLDGLQEIARLLFNRNNLVVAVTGESEEIATFDKDGGCLVDALAATPVTQQTIGPLDIPDHEAFITSSEVVFAAQGGSLLKDGNGYNGHFEVLKTYLTRDYLWNTVRQMGGAYGCFIQFSHITGNLAIISYRDPQVRKTYEAYARIPDIIDKLEISKEVLEQIIIGTYGNFDPHQSPAAKAATARNEFLSGIDIDDKRKRLQEIVSTTVADLRAFAPVFTRMKGYRAAIGNRAKIENDRDLFEKLTEL